MLLIEGAKKVFLEVKHAKHQEQGDRLYGFM